MINDNFASVAFNNPLGKGVRGGDRPSPRVHSAVGTGLVMVFAVLWIAASTGVAFAQESWDLPVTPAERVSTAEEAEGDQSAREALLSERNKMFRPFERAARSPFSKDLGVTKFLILGDSMSRELYGATMIARQSGDKIEIRRLFLDDPCMGRFARYLTEGELPPYDDDDCRGSIDDIRDGAFLSMADVIVLNAHWSRRGGTSHHISAMALAETLADQGKQVLMVGLVAFQNPLTMEFKATTEDLTVEQANKNAYKRVMHRQIDEANDDVRALAERVPTIDYLDKYALFCDDSRQTCSLYDEDKRLLFADSLHLSGPGAIYLGKRIAVLGLFN